MSRVKAVRKPAGTANEREIVRAQRQIAGRLPELIENLFKLAYGVVVETVDGEGNAEVYRTPPDRAANVYLIDRVLGKPKARVEAQVEAGEQLQQTAQVVAAATKELEAWRSEMTRQLGQSSGESAPEMSPTPATTTA